MHGSFCEAFEIKKAKMLEAMARLFFSMMEENSFNSFAKLKAYKNLDAFGFLIKFW